MDPATQQQQAMHAMALIVPFVMMFWIFGSAIIIIPFWQIYKKAGMAPALSFLMIIPLVNLVMIYVLGFSQWKVVPVAQVYGGGYPPQYPPPAYPPAAPLTAYPPAAPPTVYPPEPPSAA